MAVDEQPNQAQSHLQNTTDGYQNYYQRGLELAEAGNYQEALSHIQQHLRTVPDDAQALNDTGAILHCLGRTDEAIEHFTKAKALQTDSPEIIWNLVEAYLAIGRPNETIQLFDSMERMKLLNADVLNRAAKVFLDQNDKGKAIEMLLRSLKISSKQEVLNPMIEIIRSKRPKIAFFCDTGGMTSLNDIHEFTRQRFETHLSQGQIEQLYELMNRSDICWFEQYSDAVVEASKLPKVCINIVRLAHPETCSHWLSRVQWQNIDIIITADNSSVKDILLERVPDIQNRTQFATIPIGINLDRFRLTERQRGKNIACVGNLDIKKNTMFLLQCMQKLHYIDPEYRLFFLGNCQNTAIEQYIRHTVGTLELTDVVFFDRWNENINSWLQDKHYIASCCMADSQNTALLEGMACGLKPVIHNFPQANRVFPPEFLFNISEEFCEQILSDTYEPQRYRKFVEENHPLKSQLSKINGIFIQIETEIDSQKTETSLKKDFVENDSSEKFSVPALNNNRLDNF